MTKVIFQDTLMENEDMSAIGGITSKAIQIQGNPRGAVYLCERYSIQAIWIGGISVKGLIKLQANNTINEDGWVDITNSSETITVSTGSFLWDVDSPSYKWVRLIYDFSAGSGSMSATIDYQGFLK